MSDSKMKNEQKIIFFCNFLKHIEIEKLRMTGDICMIMNNGEVDEGKKRKKSL